MVNKWTTDKISFLKENYLIKDNIELGKVFNFSASCVSNKLNYINLHRPKEFISNLMKKNNPMYKSINKIKRHNTIKEKYPNWGYFNKGKKRIDLTIRNLENNPLKNPDKRKIAIIKSIETKKILYKEGKLSCWNKGMSKDEFLKHMPEDFMEKINFLTHTEKSRKKSSESMKKLWKKEGYKEYRLKISLRGRNHPKFGKKLPKEQIERSRLTWRLNKQDIKQSKRMINGGAIKARNGNKKYRITKPEKIVIEIIINNKINFNYVGDGKVNIGGFNPDFIDEKQKKIIEVNGKYWHSLEENKLKDIRKYNLYKKLGYQLLVIWDYELNDLKNVTNKIINFSIENNKPLLSQI